MLKTVVFLNQAIHDKLMKRQFFHLRAGMYLKTSKSFERSDWGQVENMVHNGDRVEIRNANKAETKTIIEKWY